MNYTIWIVTPEGYEHSKAFDECAFALRDALIELGHGAKVTKDTHNSYNGRVIVLGAHLLRHFPSCTISLYQESIIFNTEQIGSNSDFVDMEYIKLLKMFHVWDYSPLNIECLKTHGIDAKLCELGYAPILEAVGRMALGLKEEFIEDIDVLFIGSMNERRQRILTQLAYLGVKVTSVFGEYGAKRDRLIGRAKIVLNIHYYEAKIFEIFRCSYMMANRKCVVSEVGLDKKLESKYSGGVVFCGYDDLVGAVVKLLGDDHERKRVANSGYEIFKNLKQTDFLRGLV